MNGDILKKLLELAKEMHCEYLENEPMHLHTTFKIGGPAKLMLFPENEEQISALVRCAYEDGIRILAVGNGSNLLVSDAGIDAAVLVLDKHFADVYVKEDRIYAQAGASLMKACRAALDASLTGLEFAYGIPGSCGGAAFMNAGAYGGEMKDVLLECTHIAPDGTCGKLTGDALALSYRNSAYYDNGCVITGLCVQLKHGDAAEIKAKMEDLLARRKAKQPLEYPSAGSTFKRPEGYYAGALIEACQLKGASVGGAQVSEKHAGFVINKGGATCADVLALCRHCSDTVYQQKGVRLEMEIRVTE